MQTSITKTFKDGTVLITGSTGFLGKILMEKLLRSCSIKNIAILVRNKKGLTADQRIASIFKQTVSIVTKWIQRTLNTKLTLKMNQLNTFKLIKHKVCSLINLIQILILCKLITVNTIYYEIIG